MADMTESGARAGPYCGGLLGTGTDRETLRLRLVAEVYDPYTLEHLVRLGLGPGRRCLDVGAGAGTVARLMADRVGASGSVVATDLNLEPMSGLGADNLEVLRHDVTADPRPGAPFDLIHCRFVLEHLHDRDATLRRLASWLAPGGWLLVESMLGMPESSPPTVARLNQAIAALLRRISDLDWTWSRELPLRMEAAGLVDAAAEVHTPAIRGGTPVAALQRMSFELMREPIIAAGLLGAEEVDAGLREYDNPAFVDYNPLFIVASGRRPLQPAAS